MKDNEIILLATVKRLEWINENKSRSRLHIRCRVPNESTARELIIELEKIIKEIKAKMKGGGDK